MTIKKTIDGETPESEAPKTEIVVKPGTPVDIIDTSVPGRRMTYEGEIKSDKSASEAADQNADSFSEDFFNNQINENQSEADENTLDYFFDCLEDFGSETLQASVMRMADFAGDRFNVPCYEAKNFGFLAFRASDIFAFLPRIQAINGNSGGRFCVRVRTTKNQRIPDAVLENFIVENPEKDNDTAPAQTSYIQPNGNESELTKLLMMQMQKSDERFEKLMLLLKSEPDRFSQFAEKMMMLQMEKMMTGEKEDGNMSLAKLLADSQTFKDGLGQAMLAGLDPSEKAEEPAWKFITGKVMENPENVSKAITIFGDVANRFANMAETAITPTEKIVATTELRKAENEAEYVDEEFEEGEVEETPEEKQEKDQKLMQDEILPLIITELEGKNPLDESNETLKMLAEKFPAQIPQIKQICSVASADQVINLIYANVPTPFLPYLNISESDKQKTLVWNKKGEKIKARLVEFYEFMKK